VASTEHCLDYVGLPCTVTNWLIIQTLGRQYNLPLSRANFNEIIEIIYDENYFQFVTFKTLRLIFFFVYFDCTII